MAWATPKRAVPDMRRRERRASMPYMRVLGIRHSTASEKVGAMRSSTVIERPHPPCEHKLLMECPLTASDWAEVFDAFLAFRYHCALIAERAHEREGLSND